MMKKFKRPWLTSAGLEISREQLRKISESWDQETWEQYLTWYETPRSESLHPQRRYDQLCETSTESIFILAQSNSDNDLKKRVSTYLAVLTQQQRQVIEMIFWEGRSERHVARDLGINHKSVHRIKFRALKKISSLIKEGPSSRTMRGKFLPSQWKRGK